MDDVILLLFLLLLSAFFSGSETALTSLPMVRVTALHKQGSYSARALYRLKKNPDRMLITILIGNNVVNIWASAVATVLATDRFGHDGVGLAVGGLTLFILVFGEITPKTLAVQNATRVSLFVAPLLNLFAWMVAPVIWVLEKLTSHLHRFFHAKADPTITETELIHLARQGVHEGSIERDEQEMIQRVFGLDNLCVEDVMIPRNSIVALDGNRTIAETLPEILSQPHSRIPLHSGHLEEISHVISIREILGEVSSGNLDKSLFDSGHKAMFVPNRHPIDTLLEKLRDQKNQLVMVVDDLGILQGLLTLEDLLEELVGDITDERERLLEPQVETVDRETGSELRVNGEVALRVVEECFGVELSGKPTDSISSWILAKTGYVLGRQNERFVIDGLTVTVEKASRRAICKVRIGVADAAASSDRPGG